MMHLFGVFLFFVSANSAVEGGVSSVRLTSNAVRYPENAGTINITVSLSGPISTNTTVMLSIIQLPDQATAGVDFRPRVLNDLIFSPSSTDSESTVSLFIIDDDIVESTEAFQVIASYESITSVPLRIEIQDNGDNISMAFQKSVFTSNESSPMVVCVDVTVGSLERNVTTTLTTSPITASLTDFVSLESLELTFGSNQTTQCVIVYIVDDNVVEGDESFNITLTGGMDDAVVIPNPQAIGIIKDLDGGVVTFYDPVTNQPSSVFFVMEGNVNTPVQICVQLRSGTEPTERRVQVVLNTESRMSSGSGMFSASGDIPLSDAEITFPIGSNDGSVLCTNITIIGDMNVELARSFDVTMKIVNSADVIQGSSTATVTINNDASAVDCGNLENPVGGRVMFFNTTLGAMALYECIEGYRLLEGNVMRVCQHNGNWSGEAIKCIKVDCGSLPDPSNGRVVPLQDTLFESSVSYDCDSGFNLNGGSIVRSCLSSGNWSGSEPECIAVDCGPLHNPSNGTVELDQGTLFKANVSYACDNGYNLANGSINRTCLSTGNWSGSEPQCNVVDCGFLPYPTNGHIQLLQGTQFEANAFYSCNSGYNLDGDRVRTCLSTGNWSGSEPQCNAIDCGALSNIANGMVVQDQGPLFKANASYNCDSGFTLQGNRTRTCLPTGHWSGSEPLCNAVNCGILPPLNNGLVVLDQGTFFKANASYSCNSGFTLEGGNRIRTCLSTGRWSGSEPLCNVVDCGPLPNPINGQVLLDQGTTTYDATAFYSCNNGYHLPDGVPNERMCLPTGNWSGSEPQCISIDCGPLENPQNGLVSVNSTILNSTAIYSCDLGFVLIGETGSVCQPNGRWSGSRPHCNPIECGALETPANGSVHVTNTTAFSMAYYSCDLGFALNVTGSATRTCQNSGVWSGVEPSCQIVMCGFLVHPVRGRVVVTGGVVVTGRGAVFGSVAHYNCSDGNTLQGNKTRVCMEDGNWTGTAPLCIFNRSSAGSSRTLVTIATSVGVVGFLVAVCINCAIICFAIARRHQTRKYYFKPGGTIEFDYREHNGSRNTRSRTVIENVPQLHDITATVSDAMMENPHTSFFMMQENDIPSHGAAALKDSGPKETSFITTSTSLQDVGNAVLVENPYTAPPKLLQDIHGVVVLEDSHVHRLDHNCENIVIIENSLTNTPKESMEDINAARSNTPQLLKEISAAVVMQDAFNEPLQDSKNDNRVDDIELSANDGTVIAFIEPLQDVKNDIAAGDIELPAISISEFEDDGIANDGTVIAMENHVESYTIMQDAFIEPLQDAKSGSNIELPTSEDDGIENDSTVIAMENQVESYTSKDAERV